MKRRFLIEVDIDTETPGISCQKTLPDGNVLITLRDDTKDPMYQPPAIRLDPIPVLLHELGHAVGMVLRTPKHVGLNHESWEAMVVSREQEAWSFAEAMLHFQYNKQRALETYYRD